MSHLRSNLGFILRDCSSPTLCVTLCCVRLDAGFGSQEIYNFQGEKKDGPPDRLEDTQTRLKNVTKPSKSIHHECQGGRGFSGPASYQRSRTEAMVTVKVATYSCAGCLLYQGHRPMADLFSTCIHLLWGCTPQKGRCFPLTCTKVRCVLGGRAH